MGQNAPHQAGDATSNQAQVEHIPDADQVDQFQQNVDGQAFKYDATGIIDSFLGDSAGAKAAFAKASQIESAPVATGGGGGYSFTPAQIEDQLNQCDELITGLRTTGLQNAGRVAATQSPANDPFSRGQASETRAMGERLVTRINNQVKFIQGWQGQLKAVRQNYLNQEGNTEATWKQLSGGNFNDA